ncbi:MAG: heavy-metal-associated domain-containing protein [Gemmatimonadales bacterium]|nr:heavy-metal-associated domain-containing protein [Gemmatimonadales bacterium]
MSKLLIVGAVALLGAAPLCSTCLTAEATASNPDTPLAVATADTVVTKLAIAGMTCGSCATTAHLVFQRVPGVYHAEVSYDSAFAVIRYDPARTEPATFIAKLKEMTGYTARIVGPTAAKPKP